MIIPSLTNNDAEAYGLIQNRKITLSSSADGSIAAGQGLTYEVEFDVFNTTSIAGMVIDFCTDSPIIGDACTGASTAGFHTNFTTTTLNQTAPLAGFSIDAINSTASKFVLTHGTSYTPGANETLNFNFVGVDNPETVNTTFYARIITFTTTAGAQAYDSSTENANNPGAEPPVIDAGGVALSTAEQITVTSKVSETLTFCVYTSAANYADCTGVTGAAVTLGDTNGVLSTGGPFVDITTKYNVATNASIDATIRVKGDTLQTGAFDITSIGGTAAASSTGNEQFGMCTYTDPGSTDSATLTPSAPYNNANCNTTTQSAGSAATGGNGTALFAFDDTNTATTYGDDMAIKTAGDVSTGIIAFIGNISNTTEAGIYTSVLTFIATGTY